MRDERRRLGPRRDWARKIAVLVVAVAAGITTFFLLLAVFDTREASHEEARDAADE